MGTGRAPVKGEAMARRPGGSRPQDAPPVARARVEQRRTVARPIGPDGLDLDWWAVVRAGEPPESPPSRVAHALLEYSRMRREGVANIGFESAAED